ncbi:CHAT domain-containing protein [Pedobacter caeni]|uniref:Tetratricopeptide repeat-containing protein n=1 Tax=Pedobacter caeni TaxID=288992 RepID=A0A1M4ZIZ1_9SPHI|nr:CHAT domain-containing tetratricopeptide repeat protein [Pedobacter caeni]SHF18003.1 Tetratricopeptide repeat-containing protein [Pedobacter caeni]
MLGCLFALLFSFSMMLNAQTVGKLPVPIKKALDSLKKNDNLSEWIYSRIDYTQADPGASLPFLMNSTKDAWRKPKTEAEMQAWVLLLSHQGYNQMYAGNILNSINCYEQAYNYWQDHNVYTDISDFVLKPWANNYTRLGDYEKAIFIQQKTLSFAVKENNDALIASTYNNLGISYRSIGDFNKALQCIQLGKQKVKPGSAISILLNNTLADIYKDKNQLKEAEVTISANIALQRNTKQNEDTAYWLLSSYITAGDVQLAQKKFSSAVGYYQLALKTNDQYYRGNRLREKANVITQLGKIKLGQREGKAALLYFNQTLSSLGLLNSAGQVDQNKIFGDNRLQDVFYQRSIAYSLSGAEKEALQNIRWSLLAGDKIRFELADVKTKQRFQSETKQMAEKAIAIAFRLLEKTGQHHYAELILNLMEQTKARTLLDDIRRNQQQLSLQTRDTLFLQKQNLESAIAYQEKLSLQNAKARFSADKNTADLKFKLEYINKKLRERYPALAWNGEATMNTQTILKRLPAKAHFIVFFSGISHIYAIEIHNRQVKQITRIPDAIRVKQQISNFVESYYSKGPEAMMNDPKAFFDASYRCYHTLMGDFNFHKNEHLIIVPDEVLGKLSFEGLITAPSYQPSISRWPFFIRKQNISYAFSIQTWLNQSKRKQGPADESIKSTALTNSNEFAGLFITHQGKDKAAIPAVAFEAAALKKLVSGNFLIDKDAKAKDFFKEFEQADVLHISTHSYLSGTRKEPTLAFHDEQVFLFELSARQRAPALVVLSACRTADGMMADGEGIISLSRGFAAIGTQGTIASLWNVNDDAAAKITADTYKNLLEGKEISASLHEAKLNWLNSPQQHPAQYLPYYWDALIFIGYDQSMTLPPAEWPLGYYIALLSIAALIAAYVFFRFKR